MEDRVFCHFSAMQTYVLQRQQMQQEREREREGARTIDLLLRWGASTKDRRDRTVWECDAV